jgi:hypothetical protein
MSITVLLVLIIVLAFVLGGVVQRRLPHLATRSGMEFALLGLVLGPEIGFGVLGKAQLAALNPFLQGILGLVGFVLGLRARALFSGRRVAFAGMVAALGCCLSLAAVTVLLLMNSAVFHTATGADRLLFQRPLGTYFGNVFELTVGVEHLQLSLGIATAVSVSSLGLRAAGGAGNGGAVSNFLRANASASQLVGIALLGLLLAASRATESGNRFSLSVGQWSVATIAVGILCGVLFAMFIGREQDRMRIFLATVGLVTFASGVGEALGVSPMFVNLLAGVTVAGLSPHATALRDELHRLEQPLRIIVMVFVGALWLAPSLVWWAFALFVFLLRWAFKRFWTYVANRLLMGKSLKVRKLGDGVLSQGAVAAAIAASLAQEQSVSHRGWILTTVLVVALLSEFLSESRFRALLYSAGEPDDPALGKRSPGL